PRAPQARGQAAPPRPPPAATTTPSATAGGPLTAPLISTCQAVLRRLTAAALRVASGGWPSRARSPRYIGQSPPEPAWGDGGGAITVPHATERTRRMQTPANRRRLSGRRLLAAVNRAGARRRRFPG